MSDLGTAQPYIASYLVFRKGDTIAFLLRQNVSWMSGYYGLPSGKVEIGESYIEAAIREAKEETGVSVRADDLRFVLAAHRYSEDNDYSWVDVFFEVTKWVGELINAEPEVHAELAWFSLDDLPENTVESVKLALEAIRAGSVYTEIGWK